MSTSIAADCEQWVKEAAGETAGMTVCAQVAKAFRNLRSVGYRDKHWRIRAAWFGHAGCWSGAALRELEKGYRAWDARQAALAAEQDKTNAVLLRAAAQALEANSDAELDAAHARSMRNLADQLDPPRYRELKARRRAERE